MPLQGWVCPNEGGRNVRTALNNLDDEAREMVSIPFTFSFSYTCLVGLLTC
jgi:hypothetical protein